MIKWNNSITLFVKEENVQTGVDIWHKFIINNCFISKEYITNVLSDKIVSQTVVNVCIPKPANYITPFEYESSLEKNTKLTFKPDDKIILMAVDDIVDETTKGKRMNDIIGKYKAQGSFSIKYVNEITNAVNKHFEIRSE